MPKVIDLTGQRFGKLTVLREAEKKAGKKGVYWLCQCDCGNTKVVYGGDLRRGRATSCGCNPIWNKIDLTGQRFGKLTVLHEAEKEAGKKGVYWVCQCDCGNTTVVHGQHLRKGLTKSCGCNRYQNKVDMTGKQFGKWTVLRESEQRNGYWVCQCECGTIREVSGEGLRVGKSASCGCSVRADDLTGQRFGKLTVQEFAGYGFWNCKCDCGNIKKIKGDTLRKGKAKSCGCAFGLPKIDLTGQRFGKLTVLRRSDQKKYYWVCQCDCGNTREYNQSYLRSGKVKDCGCDITGQRFGKLTVLRECEERKGYWLCQCECGRNYEVNAKSLQKGKVKPCRCERHRRKRNYELLGERFGKLTVLRECEERKGYWLCQCDCGNTREYSEKYIRSGKVQSCGCDWRRRKRDYELLGERFGKLTVLRECEERKGFWLCQCECGNTREYSEGYLRSGKVLSCGCVRKKQKELPGKRFGKLTVLRRSERKQNSWVCQCDCGNTREYNESYLRSGKVKSCGCDRENQKKNGLPTGIIYVKSTDAYRASIHYNRETYQLRQSKNVDDCIAIRLEAENAIENGNFLEWYESIRHTLRQRLDLDLTGQQFGKLTVLRECEERKGFWLCQCDCGNTREYSEGYLRFGKVQSCGCDREKCSPNFIDMTGQRFGKLTVLRRSDQKKYYWVCQCDCGNTREYSRAYLRAGKVQSCGCNREKWKRNFIDMTGQRFGKLTVLHEAEKEAGKKGVYWVCQCDCGNTREYSEKYIRSGKVQSCGCLTVNNKENHTLINSKYRIYYPEKEKPINKTASGVSVHSLGFKMQYIRERRNMAPKELGLHCGVSRAAVKFWENNLRAPDDDKLDMIAEALNVNVSALYDRRIRNLSDIIHVLFEIAEDGCIFPDENGIQITNDSLQKAIAQWADKYAKWKAGQLSNEEYYDWQDAYVFADLPEKEKGE